VRIVDEVTCDGDLRTSVAELYDHGENLYQSHENDGKTYLRKRSMEQTILLYEWFVIRSRMRLFSLESHVGIGDFWYGRAALHISNA